jgi:hypothetical protein
MCGDLRKTHAFWVQCCLTQCDLLCAAVDNISLHHLSQQTLTLYCNEKMTAQCRLVNQLARKENLRLSSCIIIIIIIIIIEAADMLSHSYKHLRCVSLFLHGIFNGI